MRVIDLISDNPNNKFAPYQYMANAIIDVTQKHGDCIPHDLWALGFTKQETHDCWHMAYAMANVELRLMNKEQPFQKRLFGRFSG